MATRIKPTDGRLKKNKMKAKMKPTAKTARAKTTATKRKTPGRPKTKR